MRDSSLCFVFVHDLLVQVFNDHLVHFDHKLQDFLSTTSFKTSSTMSSTTKPPPPPPPHPPKTSSTSSSTSTKHTSTSSTAPPHSTKTCSFGTAYGYQHPVKDVKKSYTLNSQSGAGCKRWGWYEIPSLSELRDGSSVSGPLYVGAGGNDIAKAIEVGYWKAWADSHGRVTVKYQLHHPPYTLAEVNVHLGCLPLNKCSASDYGWRSGPYYGASSLSTSPLEYPDECPRGEKVALIVHAKIEKKYETSTCPPPKAF